MIGMAMCSLQPYFPAGGCFISALTSKKACGGENARIFQFRDVGKAFIQRMARKDVWRCRCRCRYAYLEAKGGNGYSSRSGHCVLTSCKYRARAKPKVWWMTNKALHWNHLARNSRGGTRSHRLEHRCACIISSSQSEMT